MYKYVRQKIICLKLMRLSILLEQVFKQMLLGKSDGTTRISSHSGSSYFNLKLPILYFQRECTVCPTVSGQER